MIYKELHIVPLFFPLASIGLNNLSLLRLFFKMIIKISMLFLSIYRYKTHVYFCLKSLQV